MCILHYKYRFTCSFTAADSVNLDMDYVNRGQLLNTDHLVRLFTVPCAAFLFRRKAAPPVRLMENPAH
jgi:hypothetical protein